MTTTPTTITASTSRIGMSRRITAPPPERPKPAIAPTAAAGRARSRARHHLRRIAVEVAAGVAVRRRAVLGGLAGGARAAGEHARLETVEALRDRQRDELRRAGRQLLELESVEDRLD